MRTHALPIPLTRRLLRCLARVGLALVWATLVGRPAAYAQTFNSGSTGADGALNLTTPSTVIFDPRTFTPPLDPEGDNVYHFTTINIAVGVTVRLLATHVNGPVFWLASGAVQIDGVIDLDGGPGQNATSVPANRVPSVPGAGGYPGGIGGNQVSPPQSGSGPVGGAAVSSGSARGGGISSNSFLVPLVGGSGGGGSRSGIGGGAGGGAILIASSVSLAVNGTIRANGGTGGARSGNDAGGSGGAGSLRLVAPLISGAGTLRVQGGPDTSGFNLGTGSAGRIRLEAFQHTFVGNDVPSGIRILASPFALFLPSAPPSALRVLSVAGVPVASDPTGSFTTPDVTFNAATAVPVVIEAHNIPPGTVVKLHLFPENGPDQIVDSPPLAGTLTVSTATASAVLPAGFSRGFVHATWTP